MTKPPLSHMMLNEDTLADEFDAILGYRTSHSGIVLPGGYRYSLNKIGLVGDSLLAYSFQNITVSAPGGSAAISSQRLDTILQTSTAGVVQSHGLHLGGKTMWWSSSDISLLNQFTADRVSFAAGSPPYYRFQAPATGLSDVDIDGGSWVPFMNLQRYHNFGSMAPYYIAGSTGHWGSIDAVGCYGGVKATLIDALYTKFIAGSQAGLIFISAGTNDILAGASGSTAAANVLALADRCIADGRKPAVLNLGLGGYSGGQVAEWSAFMAALTAGAATRPKMTIIDVLTVVGSYAGTPQYWYDTFHPSALGAHLIGAAARTALSAEVTPTDLTALASHINTTTADMSGTGGTTSGTGASGSVATNWGMTASWTGTTTGSTMVASKNGSQQRVVITPGASITGWKCALASSASFHASVSAGDTIYVVAAMTLAGFSKLCETRVGLSLVTLGNGTDPAAFYADGLSATWGLDSKTEEYPGTSTTGSAKFPQTDRTIYVRSAPITIAAGDSLASANIAVLLRGDGNAGGTVDIGPVKVFKAS